MMENGDKPTIEKGNSLNNSLIIYSASQVRVFFHSVPPTKMTLFKYLPVSLSLRWEFWS